MEVRPPFLFVDRQAIIIMAVKPSEYQLINRLGKDRIRTAAQDRVIHAQ